MKCEKKNIVLLALAAMLSFVITSGSSCNEQEGGSGSGSGAGASPDKNINVTSWEAFDKDAKFMNMALSEVGEAAVSGDAKWVYFMKNDGLLLRAWNVDGEANFDANRVKDANWLGAAWPATGTGLAPAPGKDAMLTAVKAQRLVATKSGVLVERTVSPVAPDAVNGVVYMVGNTYTSAWAHTAGAASILADATANSPIRAGFGLMADGKETPVFFSSDHKGRHGASAEFAAVVLDHTVLPNGGGAFGSAPFTVNTTDKTFVVDNTGLSLLPAATLGTGADITPVAAMPATAAAATWVQTAGTPNNGVKAVLAKGSDIFIALNGAAANTGGVVKCSVNAAGVATCVKPAAAWSNKTVLALATDGTKVFAALADQIVEVDAAAAEVKMGAKLGANLAITNKYDTAVDGYDATTPSAHITGLVFVGKKAIIITSDKGALHTKVTVKVVPKS